MTTEALEPEVRSAGQVAIALLTAAHSGESADVYDELLNGANESDVLAATVGITVALLQWADTKEDGFSKRKLREMGLALEGMR